MHKLLAGCFLFLLSTLNFPLYSQGLFVDSNTVALWHFDEGTGNILHDASPFHHDGKIFNAQWVEGKFGHGLHFDGVTSYVVVPLTDPLRPTDAFSIEAWFNLDALQFGPENHAVILSTLGQYPDGGGYQININDDGLQFDYRAGNPISNFSHYVPLSSTHTFYKLLATYERIPRPRGDVTLLKIYLNDGLVDSVQFAEPIQYYATENLFIGTNLNGRAAPGGFSWAVREFPGILDEIRISNVARHPGRRARLQLFSSKDRLFFPTTKVGAQSVESFDVTNISWRAPVHVDSITSSNPAFTVNQPGLNLAPQEIATLHVTYSPSTVGIDSGVIVFSSSDTNFIPLRIHVRGRSYDLAPAPTITGVRDIPTDQGNQVRVIWARSVYDSAPESVHVTEYSLWRRVEGMLGGMAASTSMETMPNATSAGIPMGFNDGKNERRLIHGELWDFITRVPAVHFEEYSCVAPTVGNMTRWGTPIAVFRVATHISNGDFYFSAPDSGFSIDNIFPPPPHIIDITTVDGGIKLTWDDTNPSADLREYRVYRSLYREMPSEARIPLALTFSKEYLDRSVDPASTYYYAVTAVDNSENESAPSDPVSFGVTAVLGEKGNIPSTYMLPQNYPNPFNPSTNIQYGLPVRSHVKLTIVNVLGQYMTTLLDGDEDAGFHSVPWKPTGSSGVYFVRLEATGLQTNSRAALMTEKILYVK